MIGGANHQDGWVSDGKGVDAWFASNIDVLTVAAGEETCNASIPED